MLSRGDRRAMARRARTGAALCSARIAMGDVERYAIEIGRAAMEAGVGDLHAFVAPVDRCTAELVVATRAVTRAAMARMVGRYPLMDLDVLAEPSPSGTIRVVRADEDGLVVAETISLGANG